MLRASVNGRLPGDSSSSAQLLSCCLIAANSAAGGCADADAAASSAPPSSWDFASFSRASVSSGHLAFGSICGVCQKCVMPSDDTLPRSQHASALVELHMLHGYSCLLE